MKLACTATEPAELTSSSTSSKSAHVQVCVVFSFYRLIGACTCMSHALFQPDGAASEVAKQCRQQAGLLMSVLRPSGITTEAVSGKQAPG